MNHIVVSLDSFPPERGIMRLCTVLILSLPLCCLHVLYAMYINFVVLHISCCPSCRGLSYVIDCNERHLLCS